ncbi:13067_t:CDS:2, partial [Dentiscutata erythropus]
MLNRDISVNVVVVIMQHQVVQDHVRPKQIQAQVPGRPKRGGPKQNQQNIPQIKQIPIKQRPVIREDQIRDDRIVGDQAKQIIIQPKIPIPRQLPIPVLEPQLDRGVQINIQEEICSICLTAFDIENLGDVVIPCRNNHIFHFRCINRWNRRAITCPICRIPLQPDELWRNVLPENILRPPDAIALQGYREIQVNELPEEQIIIEEEEEFDQQDVLDCLICHISLHQGGNVIQLLCFQPLLRRRVGRDHILQIMRRNRDQRLNLERVRRRMERRARRRIEERQRDMDQQVREDVDVIDNNVQQIVVEKQPPPLQQNEDRNMDPRDFTRCSICNTPLREAMNGNPEV